MQNRTKKMTGPMLNTERLILRPYQKSDASDIVRQLKDRAVTRYTYMPYPYTAQDYFGFLRRISTPTARKANMVFALIDRESDKVIGAVGVHNLSVVNRSAEIGYWLAKKFWGKGYVVEAVNMVVAYLFTERKLVRVYAKVFHPNTRSARVLEKAGFTSEGRLRKAAYHNKRWCDELLFGLLREDWSKRKPGGKSHRVRTKFQ